MIMLTLINNGDLLIFRALLFLLSNGSPWNKEKSKTYYKNYLSKSTISDLQNASPQEMT